MMRWVGLAAASLALWGSLQGSASAQYARIESSATFASLSAPQILTEDAADELRWSVSLPFAFQLFDETHLAVTVSTNGVLAFPGGRSVGYVNPSLDSSDGTASYVAPFWDDLRLYAGSGARIAWTVEGSAPSRTFVVEWLALSRYGYSSSAFSFQVRLFEGSAGRIELAYGPIVSGGASVSATLGVEGASAALAALAVDCSPYCNVGAWPGNGTVIAFTQDPGPDLAVTEAQMVGPLVAGRDHPARVTVSNLHGLPLGPVPVAIQLARDVAFTRPVEVGRASLSVPAFGQSTAQLVARPPDTLDPGSYHVRALVDPDRIATDVDRDNDRLDLEAPVTVLPGGPNWVARSISPSTRTATPGAMVEARLVLDSDGSRTTAETEAAVVWSSNRLISTRDRELARLVLPSTAPGARLERTLDLPLPSDLGSGAGWVGLIVDPERLRAEASESDDTAVSAASIVIEGARLVAVGAMPRRGFVSEPFEAQLRVSSPGATFRLASGSLPEGLELGAEGTLSGIPVKVETTSGSIEASAEGRTLALPFEIRIEAADAPTSVPLRALPVGTVETPYELELPIAGVGSDTATVTAEGLPLGLTLVGRVLGGIPRAAGISVVQFVAESEAGANTTVLSLEIVERGPLRIPAAQLPALRVGTAIEQRLRSSGGVGARTWAAERLPSGLELSAEGTLSGTPTRAGAFPTRLSLADAEGATTAESVQWTVDPGAEVIGAELTGGLPEGTVGVSYRAELVAEGAIRVERQSGDLPDGLEATSPTSETWLLEGLPSAPGRWDLLIETESSDGTKLHFARTLVIRSSNAGDDLACRCAGPKSSSPWMIAVLSGLTGALLRRRRDA